VSDELDDLNELLGDDGPEMSLTDPKLVESADGLIQQIWSAGAEGWATLLNRGVFYTAGSTDFNDPGELIPSEIGECVVTEVKWTGDREGTFTLVVPILAAKSVVAFFLALMGVEATPEETELDEEGMDAYTEAINNFLGQASQALRQDPGGEVALAAESTRIVDFVANAPAMEFGTDFRLCADGQLTIEGASPVNVHTLLDPALTGMEASIPSRPEKVSVPEGAEAGVVESVRQRDIDRAKRLHIPIGVTLAEKQERLSTIMNLVPGSILEFRKAAEELLDLRVGNLTIARGEAVIVEERFGLQIRKMVRAQDELNRHPIH